MKLTELETKALKALADEQLENDDCFGLVECVEWPGDRKQLGALITSLQKKGYIESIEVIHTSDKWTQYVLTDNVYTKAESVVTCATCGEVLSEDHSCPCPVKVKP